MQCANHWNNAPTKPSAKLTTALSVDVSVTFLFIILASFLLKSLEFFKNAKGREHHPVLEPVFNQCSLVFGLVQFVDQELVIHVDEKDETISLVRILDLQRTIFIELEM